MEMEQGDVVVVETASTNCVEKLSDLLSSGNCAEALELVQKSDNKRALKDSAWDIIPVVATHLGREFVDKHPDMYASCVDILLAIADVAPPEEALLEFIEQAESSENDDARFTAMLPSMQLCLNKMPEKRGNSLEWCFNAIHGHLVGLPLPEDHNLHGDERKLIDSDPNHHRITNVYEAVVEFYKPFLRETLTELQKKNTICFLFQLLGKPLLYLDLEGDLVKTRARRLAEEIVGDIATLHKDLFWFLKYAEQREMEDRSRHKEITPDDYYADGGSSDVYQRHDKLPTISVASFYYLVLGERILLDHAPCVYHPLYVWLNVIYLTAAIFKVSDVHDLVVRKGLRLFLGVASRFSDGTMSHRTLDSAVHATLAAAICDVAIYAVAMETRKLSVECLRDYLFKLDVKGRYLLLGNLIRTVEHSSLIGYLTMQLKTIVGDSLVAAATTPRYFCGARLYGLVLPLVRLRDGAETDLAEHRDRILAALNLLFFVLSRDKDNVTGLWDKVDDLHVVLLSPLKEAIEVSRAHYQLRLNDLNDFQTMTGRKKRPELPSNVSVNIAGGDSNNDEAGDMKRVVNYALNGFHLMESGLALLNKCIQVGR